jgi:hypothetical protein
MQHPSSFTSWLGTANHGGEEVGDVPLGGAVGVRTAARTRVAWLGVEGSEQTQSIRIDVPADLEGGVFANFLSVWSSPHNFTLDFAAMQVLEQDESGNVTVPHRVTARVQVPPTLVFSILRALNEQLAKHERAYGDVKDPAPPTDGDEGAHG